MMWINVWLYHLFNESMGLTCFTDVGLTHTCRQQLRFWPILVCPWWILKSNHIERLKHLSFYSTYEYLAFCYISSSAARMDSIHLTSIGRNRILIKEQLGVTIGIRPTRKWIFTNSMMKKLLSQFFVDKTTRIFILHFLFFFVLFFIFVFIFLGCTFDLL